MALHRCWHLDICAKRVNNLALNFLFFFSPFCLHLRFFFFFATTGNMVSCAFPGVDEEWLNWNYTDNLLYTECTLAIYLHKAVVSERKKRCTLFYVSPDTRLVDLLGSYKAQPHLSLQQLGLSIVMKVCLFPVPFFFLPPTSEKEREKGKKKNFLC